MNNKTKPIPLKSKKRKKSHYKIPRTVQQTLPYLVGYQNGTIQLETGRFSKTMQIPDISFKTQSEENQRIIYEDYEKLLNSLHDQEELFFHFANLRQDTSNTLEAVLPAMTGDSYDEFRNEMANMIENKVIENRNNITTKKYATIRLDAPTVDDAMKRLNEFCQTFRRSYKKITKEDTKELDLSNRMYLMNQILNSNKVNPWFQKKDDDNYVLDYESMAKQGVSTKDIICPEGIRFAGNYFEIDDRFGRSFFLDNISNWLNTNFLAELSEVNFESCITLHIIPIPQDEANDLIHKKSINLQVEADNFTDHNRRVPKKTQNALDQVDDLQDDLMNRDQKMFYMSLNMVIFADSKDELYEATDIIRTISTKYMTRIQPAYMQQERAFVSALPFGVDRMFEKRLLSTESLAIFIPFDEVNVFDKEGFYYGYNAINKSLIIHNRLKGQNYNGLILGSPGSGKSFASKREIANVFLNTDSYIYVIDPDGEYTPIGETFNASIIDISPGNGVHINPFDLDIDISHDSDFNPLTMKTDFVCGLLETMMGSGAKLSPVQRSIVDRCVQQIYKPYLEHLAELPPLPNGKKRTIDRDFCPTMQNLFDAFLSQSQPEAQYLALVMESFTTGTFDTFAHRTNVDRDNRFIIYKINNIGANLMELALQICMNDVWNKMMENRRSNRWTWFYIDEFHLLLNSESSASFLKTVWKRSRKWQGVPTGMTQNVEELLSSSAARTIINTSSFVQMMNLLKMDRDMMAELLELSSTDLEYITNVDSGCGLIYTGKQSIPFCDNFPENTKLYKLMSTSPKDHQLSA